MARIDDIERRLLNWARWKAGPSGGSMGYARTNWGADVGTSLRYRDAKIPTVDCEAEETDRAVTALPGELRATVVQVYLCPGPDEERAARLQCARVTMHARISRAHVVLQVWLSDLAGRRKAERERVEGIDQQRRKYFST